MNYLKRISIILLVVIFLSSFFAIPVHAVDPVSASVISNAFAQAITAYGASNGVSLTFDGINSGNTSQIGENIHALWSKFRSGQQTADDYETIAQAVFPGLYNKVIKAGGAAVVGINLAEEYMPDIDEFWNWLLSGPAEMVKVDNAYQWNNDPVTGSITPIQIYFSTTINGVAVAKSSLFTISRNTNFNPDFQFRAAPANGQDLYAYQVTKSGTNYFVFFGIDDTVTSIQYRSGQKSTDEFSNWSTPSGISRYQVGNYTYPYYAYNFNAINDDNIPIAALVNNSYAPNEVLGLTDSIPSTESTGISVQPYIGDAVARPVPIPDVTDPDYGPIPWTGDLGIPWNDTLFGDGTGTLTGEQATDIVGTIDNAIVSNPDKTIELDTETDIPVNPDPPTPSEVVIPFLPVVIPSFDFSLSGIWHYVREWVSSLGAWFAVVFTVWSYLPYALVVPVYASAVIVIVLGIYKRFFM